MIFLFSLFAGGQNMFSLLLSVVRACVWSAYHISSSNLLLKIGANNFCFNLPFNFWKSSKSHHHYQPSLRKWPIPYTLHHSLPVGELKLNCSCAYILFWIVQDTAVVNSCGVRISQVGSGSLQDLCWVLYTPPRQFPSSRCKVWRGAKSRHSCQKNRVSINAVMGQKSSAKCTRQIFWKPLYLGHLISHALSESKIEKQQHISSSSPYSSLQCLAYPSCGSSAVGTKTHRTSKHWESKKGIMWCKTAQNDFKRTISCLA